MDRILLCYILALTSALTTTNRIANIVSSRLAQSLQFVAVNICIFFYAA